MKESKNITLTTLLEKHAELYEYFEPGVYCILKIPGIAKLIPYFCNIGLKHKKTIAI